MIIRSLLENDVYKWNMSYAIMKTYPFAETVFKFKDRKNEVFDQDFVDQFNLEVESLCTLRLKPEEKKFLIAKFYWIPKYFFDWFENFKFDSSNLKVWLDDEKHFCMESRGLAYENEFWEVPLLAIFSELRTRYRGFDKKFNRAEALEILNGQIALSNENQLYFSEFGLRRRFSGAVQEMVDKVLVENSKCFVGNSNVYMAFKNNTPISGTQAHSWIMLNNAFVGYRLGNYHAMKNWNDTFGGSNGIFLVDTIGIDQFLNNLPQLYAKAADGFRWDSGTWESFTSKVIARLVALKVDPLTKTLVYSDSINMQKFLDIYRNVRGRVGHVAAGIGGALTNNTGVENASPQVVMKLSEARINKNSPWIPCVKCPDTEGKYMGDKNEVELCLRTIGRDDELVHLGLK